MSRVLNSSAASASLSRPSSLAARPAYQSYLMLLIGFAVLPVVAGLDKFFHLLAGWDQYLTPVATQYLPVSGHTFMLAVGAIEITAGLLVAFSATDRSLRAYVVAIWLWGVVVNLLLIQGYYDIVLRDFGLSLGAVALARLSQDFSSRPLGV